jgi:hypothetical protein
MRHQNCFGFSQESSPFFSLKISKLYLLEIFSLALIFLTFYFGENLKCP